MIFFVIVGDRFRIADEAEGKLTAMVQENLTGVRVVRAFGRERFEKDKFNKQNDLFSDLWVRLGHVMGVNWGIGDLLSGIQVLTIIAAGIVFVVDGAITEGEYLAFVAYNSMLVWPTRSLGRLLSELSKPASAPSVFLKFSTRSRKKMRKPPLPRPWTATLCLSTSTSPTALPAKCCTTLTSKFPQAPRSAFWAPRAAAKAR